MKPIQLTMCAFGPYKGKEVIDFRELQGNRLFVISGATGAGKTTIFDGISFALYGNGSGTDRKENKTMRSDFAEDKLNTAVELIFEVNNKTYRVMRQLGHTKEGNKTATGEAYELLEVLADGSEVKAVERQRVTDINTRIEEIIGLTYDQFNQIIMLPQGEFRKLLTSSSENKEAILRKIFKTERYGDMAKKLEEKKQQAQLQSKHATALKDSYIEQISGALPARESQLFELLQGNANVYQIQHALAEEQLYYQQKGIEQDKQYQEAFEEHGKKQKIFLEQQSLNQQLDAFQQKQQQLQLKQGELPLYEAKLKEADEAAKANYLETYNARCVSLKKDVDQKTAELEHVKMQLQAAQQQLQHTQAQYDEEKSKESIRQQATERIRELEKLKPLYVELEQQQQTVNQLTKQVTSADKTVKKITEQLANQSELVTKTAALIDEMQQQAFQLPTMIERQQQLRTATTLLTSYENALNQLHLLTERTNTAEQVYVTAQNNYEREESNWLTNQAYHLAQQLLPGCACPVCGSLEHPTIVQATEDVVDEATLTQLRQVRDAAAQQKTKALAHVEVATKAVADLQSEIQQLAIEVAQAPELQAQLIAINEEISTLQKQVQQLVTEKDLLRRLQLDVQQIQQEKQVAEQNFYQLENHLGQQRVLFEQKQSQIPQQLADLAQLSSALYEAEQTAVQLQTAWENAQQAFEQIRSNVAKLEEALKYTTQAKEDFEARLADAKATFIEEMDKAGFTSYHVFVQAKRSEQEIAQLKQQHLLFTNELHALTTAVADETVKLQGKEKQDVTALEQQLDQLKAAYETAWRTLNQSKDYERNCIDYEEKLEAISDQIAHLEKISDEITDLYNVLKGNNTRKVSFERYVQISYLEQITEAANIHLHNLSNGQYRLTCSERQESHGRQSGLALDVYDSYTGQDRDVKTLSGGEKFNASLCLALGMADVIQSFQGNVRIDTMFIDEGFGTLDEESLMRAIDILIELQKSGRMIGVISHVAELKAAMPAILHVLKTKSGHSETKIEVR